MQVGDYESRETIFGEEYVYFSGQSQEWLKHCEAYANKMIEQYQPKSVMELASNDGSLLQYFQSAGIEVLGVEPTKGTALESINKGIDTKIEFFGKDFAQNLNKQYDVIAANNVLAHVPDLNDFIAGMKAALSPNGVITVEFPYVGNLLNELQFDTIYQEHFSYFSLGSARRAFSRHGLDIFDVDKLPTHGGSLRIYASHPEVYPKTRACHNLEMFEAMETDVSPLIIANYSSFEYDVKQYKRTFLDILIKLKTVGETIVAYGAPAKGNTLLNYCGVGTDFIDYCVDSTQFKQGKYLPGSHIPVYHPDKILETKPSVIYIQPWNWQDEIISKIQFAKEWDAKVLVRNKLVTL
jgi:SAM-dependent methyltransferase